MPPRTTGAVAVEFFCGIGGLHYALRRAAPSADVVASLDLNPVGNDVYEHNFGALLHTQTHISIRYLPACRF